MRRSLIICFLIVFISATSMAAPLLGFHTQENANGRAIDLGPNQFSTFHLVPGSASASTFKLAACANGDYNIHWKGIADNLMRAQLDKITIRPGPEFSGSWYPWSIGRLGPQANQNANYAACFRHFVTTLRTTQPSAQWKFDWNPILETTPEALTASYPGDEYVDFITTDVYDVYWDKNIYPYPTDCDSDCRLDRQKFSWSRLLKKINRIRDFAKAHSKPMAFSEWGLWAYSRSSQGGGDNPYFIQKMHDYINDPKNNVAYHIYYDIKDIDGDHQISNANTQFPQSAALFKKLFGTQSRKSYIKTQP